MTNFDKQKLFSVSLMTFGVVLLLIALGSCTPHQITIKGISYGGDLGTDADITDQQARAVRIDIECLDRGFAASGTLIGGRFVLTAAHVIPCPGAATVRLSNGMHVKAVPVKEDSSEDVMIFALMVDTNAPPIRYGPPPQAGDKICAAVAHPFKSRVCGSVVRVDTFGPGAIVNGMEVIAGNSGSGVYDESGGLVGVVSLGCIKKGCGLSGASNIATARAVLGF